MTHPAESSDFPSREYADRDTNFSPAALSFETRTAHAGRPYPGDGLPDSHTPPLAPPLFQTTVYNFKSVAEVDAVYGGNLPGNIYYRNGGVTPQLLEAALTQLEGGSDTLATTAASGMAAITAAILAIAKSGDHLVADLHAYGGTLKLFSTELPRFGIETTFVDVSDLDQLYAALRPSTRALCIESLSNPTMRLTDIPALIQMAHENHLLAIVDNTFVGPALLRPLEWGADLVWHSLAKSLGGHSAAGGGAVIGRRDLVKATAEKIVRWGGTIGAFDAWMVLQGLPTLALRMRTQSENALHIARFLSEQPAVRQVAYPGLPTNSSYSLATRLFQSGFGNMLSFEIQGGRVAVERFIKALRLIVFAPSLADVTTTLSYPYATSHRDMAVETLSAMGVSEGLIRLSVGIEAMRDIQADLSRGLAVV